MSVVVDASVVVAALTEHDRVGNWARTLFLESGAVAPHLLLVEVANVLRRARLSTPGSSGRVDQAYADLLDLPVELFPFRPLAVRVWELRETVTAYAAWYVALAESLKVDLATLDLRLARASGPRCGFRVPAPPPGDSAG